MKQMGFAMELRPGCYDEYRRRHDELWPELVELFRETGVSLTVYRLRERLILHATTPSEQDWKRLDKAEVMGRWDSYLADLFVTDEEGEIAMEELPVAFSWDASQ